MFRIARAPCLSFVALLAAGCGAESGAFDGNIAVDQEAHVGHNNEDMGNGVDKQAYRIEYRGADGFNWTKHNLIDTTTDIFGVSAWNYSKNATQVCHRRGGVYGSTGGCMGIGCSGCKTLSRLAFDQGYIDTLQTQPYWSGFSDDGVKLKLDKHSVIKNHFEHPDAAGYDADNVFMVRFDLMQGIRSYDSHTVVVELDVHIPSQTACQTVSPAAIPYVQMEASYYACDSASSRTNCVAGYIGNGLNEVVRSWNGSSCSVSIYHRVFRSLIGNRYVWNIHVAAQGGVGHLPAPVRVRIE
jgi:hypothetical protein